MREPPDSFLGACEAVGLELTDAELRSVGLFVERLLEKNRSVNLTGIRDPETAWHRHVLESLALLPHVGSARRVVDVGSGGGLPGLVLAIVRPDVKMTLIEATQKKARFIEEMAETLGLEQVRVVADRAETLAAKPAFRDRYDAATARAVGPLSVALELTLPMVPSGGRLLAMKGQKVHDELRGAGDALMTLGGGEVEVYEALPGLDDEACIVEVHKAGATPRRYPRRPGIPKQQPL